MSRPRSLSPAVLEHPVFGYRLLGPRLADNLGSGATLLVFLRQLG